MEIDEQFQKSKLCFFKLKLIPKANKEHVKKLFVAEERKGKDEKMETHYLEKRKENFDPTRYNVFRELRLSAASDSSNVTIDLETV